MGQAVYWFNQCLIESVKRFVFGTLLADVAQDLLDNSDLHHLDSADDVQSLHKGPSRENQTFQVSAKGSPSLDIQLRAPPHLAPLSKLIGNSYRVIF